MNYRMLLPGLKYRGLVKSLKTQYHVLESSNYYVVFAPKDDAKGNYNIVPKKAVKFLVSKLGGKQGGATKDGLKECSGSMYFPTRFSFLNAMYALIGVKGGRIARVAGPKLFFNIWKAAE